MRKISQIEVDGGQLFALCEDGTLWVRSQEWVPNVTTNTGAWVYGPWMPIAGPPEGEPVIREEMSLEEQAEALRQAGGRGMIIGRGLIKDE